MAKLIMSYQIEYTNGEEWGESVTRQQVGVAALSVALRMASPGELVGEEIRWPRADGYARYLVAKERPLELVHLAVGDAWQVEDALIRGLRLKEVREMVARQHGLSELFGSKASMSFDSALSMAKESLLIRADQWRELADINLVDLEEMYESTVEEQREMSEKYKQAYITLGGSNT